MEQLGLIVPFRNREEHLSKFIPHMKKFLANQPYKVFLVEQVEGAPFNRGMLLNIGFSFAKDSCQYVCFHDIDMLPVKADYSYPESPTHLATHVAQFNYEMPYSSYFGGVTLFNLHDFVLINGYYNGYFGWGLEDDDLRLRCFIHELNVTSREGIFLSLDHPHAEEKTSETQKNRLLFEKFCSGDISMLENGLNSLKYNLVTTDDNPDYFKIVVKI